MKDTIYREDAINAVEEALKNVFVEPKGLGEKIINPLPSAERTGKWIWENYVWHCDQCGKNPTYGMGYVQRKEELFDFCPHCGARMVTE